MDFDMGDMGGGSLPEGTDMSSMDEGFEVGRSNNWSLGFNASMPLVNASLWKSLSISALDVELAVEQARSSKIAMVNQVKRAFTPSFWQATLTGYSSKVTTMPWRIIWISNGSMNREP